MRKFTPVLMILVLFAASSCGGGKTKNTLEAKKTELAKYRAEMDQLKTKIDNLEKEIAALDTAKKVDDSKAVVLTEAMPSRFDHFVDVQGFIESENVVNVMATMPGVIRKVYVSDGQQVTKGQLLVDIDPGTIKESMAQLDINIATAKTVYERQKNLWDQKIGTEVQYIQAKTTYESLTQQRQVLETQLGLTKVLAPVSGTVDEVMVHAGEQPMGPMLRLVNLGELRAKAKVSDTYLAKIKMNAPVKIILPDMGDTLNSRVTYISSIVNSMNRTFTIECDIPAKGNLKANTYAKLSINDASLNNVLVVSENVIQQDSKGKFMLVAETKDGKTIASKRYVQTGLSYNGKVEIASGLSKGDRYISFGYQTISDGQPIAQ